MTRVRPPAGAAVRVALLALAVLALAGCETTAAKSARLAKLGRAAVRNQKGLVVTAVNRDVAVLSSAVLHDANGTAATVTLRNTSAHPLANVPIAITVADARGRGVWKNDTPGLEPSLVSAPLLAPRSDFTWVNDQVQPTGHAATVHIRVGASPPSLLTPPALSTSGVRLFTDPSSGVGAKGMVVNHSIVTQLKLVIFAVARRGRRVVAAGRAILPRVPPGKPVPFQIFFIGDPTGAALQLSAPPTVLR